MANQNGKKKKKKQNAVMPAVVCSVLFLVCGLIVGFLFGNGTLTIPFFHAKNEPLSTQTRLGLLNSEPIPDWIDVQIIPLDGTSRDGTALGGFNDIVIHYVGNPGTSAQANHDFYCNPESTVSSHFIVGLEGEIIQCIPLNEMSAASNWRNRDTISIEVCHPDDTGEYTEATYQSVVKLAAWLQKSGGLTDGHIIRHYDITGKSCPLYYVNHEDSWEQLVFDIEHYKFK